MKKVLSIALLLVLAFTMFGCSKKETDDGKEKINHDVDVVKAASAGQIPEIEFLLGDSVDGVKDVLFEKSAGMTHQEFCNDMIKSGYTPDGTEYASYVNEMEIDGKTILSANYDEFNTMHCIYNTDKKEAGIAAIAISGNGEAYGFDTSTMIDYVKGAIDLEPKQEEAKSNLPFLPKSEDGATRLVYRIGDYKLEFYFSNYNTLSATILYNTNIW